MFFKYIDQEIAREIQLYFRENGYYPNLILLPYHEEIKHLNNGNFRIIYDTKTFHNFEEYKATYEEHYLNAKIKVVYEVNKITCMREVEK